MEPGRGPVATASPRSFVGAAKQMRVVSVVSVERMGEFVDRPVYGVLEVEPGDVAASLCSARWWVKLRPC